jgi:hypothetical protein
MTLTPSAGNVAINPDYSDGTFSYRVSEPGRAPIYRSTEYSAAGPFNYAITQYGVYYITGLVTRAGIIGSTASYDDGIIRTYTLARSTSPSTIAVTTSQNLTNPVAKGTDIRFTAAASIAGIGSTPVQYSFWRYDAMGMVLVRDWSSENYLDWTPARVGDYTIQVRAKGVDAGSYEAIKNIEVKVTDTVDHIANVSSITVNEAYLNANAEARKPIEIKASAISTTGEGLLYKFSTYDADMRVISLQGYSVNQNCIWVPRKAGTYTISVAVKNGVSFGEYDSVHTFTVTVK